MISPFAVLVSIAVAVAAPKRGPAPSCDAAPFCRCRSVGSPGMTPREIIVLQRDAADAVVFGRVIGVDTLPASIPAGFKDDDRSRAIVARIRVERAWRGADADTVSVAYGSTASRTSCDVVLVRGVSYAIFARLGDRGLLWTRQCMGTSSTTTADSVVAALGPGRRPR